MAISLYDATVGSFLQTLGAVEAFLAKARTHFGANGVDLGEIVETRLYPDMLPFRFQLVSVAHHSRGALAGVRAGEFAPPPSLPDVDYAGLQQMISDARRELGNEDRRAIDALEGKDVVFRLGENSMPFTAEGFLLSFSIPNLHFHATTAYDILRMKGVPLGKRDYMGRPRLKS